jgi:hypothetical protein
MIKNLKRKVNWSPGSFKSHKHVIFDRHPLLKKAGAVTPAPATKPIN